LAEALRADVNLLVTVEEAEGEESSPEVALGVGIVQGRDESGEPEAGYASRPREPRAFGGFRKICFGKRIAQSVYSSGSLEPNGHQSAGLEREYLLEEIRRRPGDIGIVELYGDEAALESVYRSGACSCLRDEHYTGERITER
jgi:hypothetical protein